MKEKEIITLLASIVFVIFMIYNTNSNYIKIEKTKLQEYLTCSDYLELTGDTCVKYTVIAPEINTLIIPEIRDSLKPRPKMIATIPLKTTLIVPQGEVKKAEYIPQTMRE